MDNYYLIVKKMYDNIIIYNPHTCVVPKSLDSNCDYRSREYSNIIARKITNCVLITSDIPRYLCDNNRIQCRYSDTRNALREYIKPDNFILEIHSFTKFHNHWRHGNGVEPDIALLETHNRSVIDDFYTVLHPYFDVQIVQGSDVNDVQAEVNEKRSNGVLIELAYELTYEQIDSIASLIYSLLRDS